VSELIKDDLGDVRTVRYKLLNQQKAISREGRKKTLQKAMGMGVPTKKPPD